MNRREIIVASFGVAAGAIVSNGQAAQPYLPAQIVVPDGNSVSRSGIPKSVVYSTDFDLDENPLSEGGLWLHTDTTLTKCKAAGGRAFGTQTGTGGYDDSNAYLMGFGNDHEVEAVIYRNPDIRDGGN